MTTFTGSPTERCALIAELAKRLDGVSPQFGKTALQKLVYLLQAVYEVDCGYDFGLYSYGPFDSRLLGDLDMAEHWQYVSVRRGADASGGYRILPARAADAAIAEMSGSGSSEAAKRALDGLVQTYGAMTARDLELRATTVYIARELRRNGLPPTKDEVCQSVGQVKPKYDRNEVRKAVQELEERGHIRLADPMR